MSDGAAGAQQIQQVDLAQVSLPRLLFALLRQRFTGTVTVQQPPPHIGNRRIWFRGGMPVFTDWAAPSEVLGQVLLAQRTIDENQLLAALEAMAQSGGLLGQHLMSQGVLDRAGLVEGLRRQCLRKLVALFALRAGVVHVSVGPADDVDADLRPLNVLALILSGVGVAFDQARIDAELQAIMRAPLQATSSFAKYRGHFNFRPADGPILDALVRGGTLEDVLQQTTAGRGRVAQLVYALWACQMLRATGPARAAAPPSAAPAAPVQAPTAPAPSFPAAHAHDSAAPASPGPSGGASPGPSEPSASGFSGGVSAGTEAPAPRSPAAPAAPAPNAVSAGADPEVDDEFVIQLVELENRLEQRVHAFELFGLPVTATKRDVRRAWGDLSRLFHPDAQTGAGRAALRDRVGKVFAGLSEAQQILGDAEQREQLRASIENGEFEAVKDGKDATAQAHAVFRGEMVAKDADKLLRANKFERALQRYQEAASYNAEEPDVMAAIAWCNYQLSDKGVDHSRIAYDSLVTVIREAPKTSRAHYFLGFVLVDQNNPAAAIDSFNKASELDPRNIDAQRQVRALKFKTGRPVEPVRPVRKEKKKRGGLRGLFGKK